MVQFGNYTSQVHNDLVSIQEAAKLLDKAGGIDFINGPLRETILRHDKGTRFGIRLLHAPFDVEDPDNDSPAKGLRDNQRIVNFGNVAFAVPVDRMSPQDRAKIVATTWKFNAPDVATPVEYSLSPDPVNDHLSSSDIALVSEISKIIVASPAARVLGLSIVYPSLPGVRFKRGNSVITLPLELRGLVPGQEHYDVVWVFPPEGKAIVHCAENGGPIGKGTFDENF